MLIVGISGVLLTFALYYILSNIFLKSFQKLEYDYAESEMLSILDSFSGVLDELKGKSADWGVRDDSYNFVQSKDPKFIKSNLTDNTFLDLRLNHIALLNKKGELVYRHAHDLNLSKEVEFPKKLENLLQPGSSLLEHHGNLDSIHTGVVLLPEGILLIVTRPLVSSSKKGPIHGTLMFGRYLKETQLQQFSRLTQHVLTLQRLDDPNLPEDFKKADIYISSHQPIYVQILSPQVIAGYCEVNDIFGRPALIIRMDQPRAIYQQGLLTLRYLVLSLILAGVVFVVVGLFLLERFILAKLEVLNDEVLEIAKGGNFSGRVSLKGTDELAGFAKTLNAALEQLEQSQIEIKNSEEWFRILFEYAPDIIYLNDAEGMFIDANLKAQQLLHLPKDKIVGKSVVSLHLMNPDFLLQLKEDKIQKNVPLAREFIFLSSVDSQPVILEIQVFAITFKGRSLVLNIARDITERKSLEKMKEEFLFTVSHELRTPLAISHAFLGNLKAGTAGLLNDKQGEILDTTIRNINRLTRLINDLLDFSRLESGKASLNRKATQLNLLLEESYASFREKSKEHHLEFGKNISENVPMIYVDSDMVIQVVFNLLDNAFRFAKSKVNLSCEKGNDAIEVVVSDDGEGIPSDQLSLLFNKFKQIDRPSGGAGYKGTGLGLAICKEIIKLHQGKIWAESEVGKGTQFHFTLPLAPVPIKRENKDS